MISEFIHQLSCVQMQIFAYIVLIQNFYNFNIKK
jgi:hypothetical protein